MKSASSSLLNGLAGHVRSFLGDRPWASTLLRTLACRQYPFQFHLRSLVLIFFSRPSITKEIHKNLLFNRDPALTAFADKIASKKFGEELGIRVPETFAAWESAEDIELKLAPRNLVIKATHGSGMTIVISESLPRGGKLDVNVSAAIRRIHPDDIDLEDLKSIAGAWLATKYGQLPGQVPEWAYVAVPRRLIAEELLGNGVAAPIDYRFVCVHGRLGLVAIASGRHGELRTIHLNRDFEVIQLNWSAAPENRAPDIGSIPIFVLEKMRAYAEQISARQTILRVDFYFVNEEIVLGELTNYPQAGRARFRPRKYDRTLLRHS
jgi:hypothetical protein